MRGQASSMCKNLHGSVPSAIHPPWTQPLGTGLRLYSHKHLLLHEFAGGWTSTSEDFIAECFARMPPAAAVMDTGYGNLIKKQSQLHKEKTVEVRNVVRCAVLSETKKWGLNVGL